MKQDNENEMKQDNENEMKQDNEMEMEMKDDKENETIREKKSTVKVTGEENAIFKEDIAADLIGKNIFVRIYMSCMWILGTSVMCYYIFQIYQQYQGSIQTASSSINIITQDSLPLPEVVVCNWNQDGSVFNSTPTNDCDYCLIQLISCSNLTNNDFPDCTDLWVHSPIQTDAGLFDCYTFNGDSNNIIWTSTTGYSGAIATVWKVQLLGDTTPPTNRSGAQVSYFLAGNGTANISAKAIYDEIRFAPVGKDSFFTIQYIQTLHQEDNPPEGTCLNCSSYSTSTSSVNLLYPSNPSYGYIGISFAFQELNEEQDIFFTSFTLINFWADFANMIGVLLGLDMIKVASAVPVAVVAVRLKSLYPLEDKFNG